MINDSQLNTIESLGSFIKGSLGIDFKGKGRTEVYGWVEATLTKFLYPTLSKKEKGTLKKYLSKVTGYSRSQMTRLVKKQTETGYVKVKSEKRYCFPKKYPKEDISLLAQTDSLHGYPNGQALKMILKRLVATFGLVAFANLSRISVAHIYNLRKSVLYRRINKDYSPTRPSLERKLGERRRPRPLGKPGYVRVDSVHQGDLPAPAGLRENDKGQKGVYHINMVDEVTQSEFVGAVEKISEVCLIPILERLLEAYPFRIVEFHSDNGSEFINRVVVEILNRLFIKLTKSRSNRTTDNALVEGKNGSIVRKWLGYSFINQRSAERLNRFYFGCFNEYLNYHRPCGFATMVKDPKKKGRLKKIYRTKDYRTPYDKFKSLEKAEQYLKEGITFEMLDKIALRKTDNEMAEIVQKEREELFNDLDLTEDKNQLVALRRSGSLLD